MTDVFLRLLNVSITAIYMTVAVLVLRLLLKKAPRWIFCAMWGIVGLRLLLPVRPVSPLSLIPSAQTVPEDIATALAPRIYSGIPPVDQLVNPVISHTLAPEETTLTPIAYLLETATVLWLIGMVVMVLYCIYTYFRLYRKIRSSVCFHENVYCCDYIDTPFILGILSPRIYLPSGLDPEQTGYVIAHEQAHLKRKDHWWKPVGFVLLTVYWFNPLLWIAYLLLSRDIESACDQKVVKNMAPPEKKAYAQALAFCGTHRKMIAACPLAFGEQGVKDRIKAVLHYKKPAVWLLCIALVVVSLLAVCFLTDPTACNHTYSDRITLSPTCHQGGTQTYTCSACGDSYTKALPATEHRYAEAVTVQAPTCTQPGQQQYTCTLCRDVKIEACPAPGHLWSGGSCTEAATCSACGNEDTTEPAHTYSVQVNTAPTRYHLGGRTLLCSVCGDTRTEQYGSTGVYDLQAIQQEANLYAGQQGFHILPGPGDSADAKYTATVEYAAAESRGGGLYLRNLAYSLIVKARSDATGLFGKAQDYQIFVQIEHRVSTALTVDSQGDLGYELFAVTVYVKPR